MAKITEQLFDTCYQDVYRYLYSLSHDTSLSEDLAAEVFLEAVKSIGTFRGEANAKTWLFSIARHRWYQHLRRQKCSLQTESLTEFLEDTSKNLELVALDRELANRIQTLLNQEPERTKGIIQMRLEGYSFYEIGIKYGISESSARVIDFRARAKIRQRLKKEGFE